jgi:hypothetical protein
MNVTVKGFKSKKSKSFAEARRRLEGHYDTCPFCNQEADGTENLALLVTNQIGIPNTVIHTRCLEKFDSLEDAIQVLQKNYDKWTLAKKEFRTWAQRELAKYFI